ncbi:peptide/nickel transport system ATP-binding protein [Cognatiyoonia sediminum]|uniref:Peptide/nickel transport system ATP-binding protein n=1 Tax=Cognatiyoonia sediminum TaxID=1508389 RepID=A0A1M5MWC7_9RHOB|nr:ABC transporter ATP-binding protein [Cognatiyoonia sediminum]SHG81614.1 peptide/nickel transport system ATP-binding protein [Cognatiyoonia sediminum]
MLTVENLTVQFPGRFGTFTAIEDVSLTIERGEIHGLVGESGAGKSTIGAAIIGLLQPPGFVSNGSIHLGDTDLLILGDDEAHQTRGKRISMIFQDPQTSLNPLMTIEDQLIETIQTHEDISTEDARSRAISLLEETGIENASQRIKAYPHQFSGGMRQRVVIALALCTNPELIIADEPTTALDVAVQSQVLDLIRGLANTRGIGFLLITHDIGVIAQTCQNVTVLRGGQVMEHGPTQQVLNAPEHPYTQSLMAAVPRLDVKLDRFLVPDTEEGVETAPIGRSAEDAERWLRSGDEMLGQGLSMEGVTVKFTGARDSLFRKPEVFVALDDVSMTIRPGTVMGLVGESGSGKSTMAKVLTGLVQPTAGTLKLNDSTLPLARQRGRKDPSRRVIQMVFQDPYSSLNSRHRIGDILAEPLWLYGLENDRAKRRDLAAAMLDLVGLSADAINRYPHQFSGGQRQRIAVARSLLARPRVLICDEPTSALDVSIQAQVLNLLKDLQARFSLTILFISHNLAVVRQMSDDITVLKSGKVVEAGPSEAFFNDPQADYSQELLSLTPNYVGQKGVASQTLVTEV